MTFREKGGPFQAKLTIYDTEKYKKCPSVWDKGAVASLVESCQYVCFSALAAGDSVLCLKTY